MSTFPTSILSKESLPETLRQIADPPDSLYLWGNQELLSNQATLAIVGTRKASDYGLQTAQSLSQTCAAVGITIISGLARGIDAAAHRASAPLPGRTIAVLGSGFKKIYPPEHRQLVEHIIENQGLIISEYPPETPPLKHHFPARNRLIAALSKATLVIEAPKSSGALITASLALDYNKEVFALPGNITSLNSLGPNELIAQGATPVTDTQTLLRYFNKEPLPAENNLAGSDEELKILDLLQKQGSASLDQLIELSGLAPSSVSSVLTSLELKSMVFSGQNGVFRLKV